jgi:hypothetical protein
MNALIAAWVFFSIFFGGAAYKQVCAYRERTWARRLVAWNRRALFPPEAP